MLMRFTSTILAAVVLAVAIPVADAAQKPPAQQHGMSKGEAFNWCRDQHYNRIIQMRQCVIAKMHGE